MSSRTFNVLFLCTGNSARSIMAEALLNSTGKGEFRAHSAGSHPAGQVNPLALNVLADNSLPTHGLRSKSWDEFSVPGAPKMDFVFTLCSTAAGEACPVFPGKAMRAHWGIDDPAAAAGSEEERRAAFQSAFHDLQDRLLIFTSLPLGTLDRRLLQRRLEEIGQLGANGSTDLADRIQSASRPLRLSRRLPANHTPRQPDA